MSLVWKITKNCQEKLLKDKSSYQIDFVNYWYPFIHNATDHLLECPISQLGGHNFHHCSWATHDSKECSNSLSLNNGAQSFLKKPFSQFPLTGLLLKQFPLIWLLITWFPLRCFPLTQFPLTWFLLMWFTNNMVSSKVVSTNTVSTNNDSIDMIFHFWINEITQVGVASWIS